MTDHLRPLDADRIYSDALAADIRRQATPEQRALLDADLRRWLEGLNGILANVRGQEEDHEREMAIVDALTGDGIDVPVARIEALEERRRKCDSFKRHLLRRIADVESELAGDLPAITTSTASTTPERPSATAAPARFDVEPPATIQRRRSGAVWAKVFEAARRAPGEPMLVDISLSKSSVTQLASDIRNAHRPEKPKARLASLRRDERWDAVWGPHEGAYKVWITYRGEVTPPSSLSA